MGEEIKVRQIVREILRIVACVGLGVMAAMVSRADAESQTAQTPEAPSGQSSEAFLHSIYDPYLGPQDKVQPIDYSKPRQLLHYFEPSLADIMHRDFIRTQKADDVPTLDADPFIDAQDWEIKSFDIQVTPVDSDHANAVIKFDNAGEHRLLHLQLVRIAGNWRIHDIDYGRGEGTLRGLYKAAGSKK
jgi:hypothetical protein